MWISVNLYRLLYHSPIAFQYQIANNNLESVNSISDLGVYFDKSFTFSEHIQHTFSTAYSALGFLIRSSKDFNDINTIITLYRSNVLSILSQASWIWTPHYANGIEKIEKVQRKFLRYASFKIGRPMQFTEHNYFQISELLHNHTVASIQSYDDIILNFRILNNLITSNN